MGCKYFDDLVDVNVLENVRQKLLDAAELENRGLKWWKLQLAVKLKEKKKQYQEANNIQ